MTFGKNNNASDTIYIPDIIYFNFCLTFYMFETWLSKLQIP